VREGELLKDAVEYCCAKGLEFYAYNSNYPDEIPAEISQPRKLMVDLFIDDRNLGGLPDWGVIYRMIASGNPHDIASAELQSEVPIKKKKFGFF